MSSNQTNRLKLVVLGVVLLSALVVIYFEVRTPALPRQDFTAFISVGNVLANETVKLTGDSGNIVVLAVKLAGFATPRLDARLDSFKTALRQHPHLELLAVETIHFDPPNNFDRGVPVADYLAVLDKYPTADAVVSLAGAPAFQAGDFDRLPARAPKLVCFSNSPKQLLPLFEHGVIQTAIIPRLTPLPASGKRDADHSSFDQQYVILTTSNAAAVLGEFVPGR